MARSCALVMLGLNSACVPIEMPTDTTAAVPATAVPHAADTEAHPKISLADLREKYQVASSRYIDLDGVNLHYADEGAGQPVLLLPPSFLNFRAWDGVAQALVDNNYRVIRPDFPSTGLSGLDALAKGDEPVDFFNRNAEIVAKLVDELDLGQVYVVGTSSGAMAGFRFASYHPEMVNRLVLINSAGLPRTRQSNPNRNRAEERQWARMAVKPPEYWANLLSRNFFEPQEAPDWLVSLAYDVNRRSEEVAPGSYAFKTGDPKSILAGVTAATLIQWGKSNPTVVHLDADVFEHWMTGAPTLIRKYDGLGHYPYLENEELIVSDILAFLSGGMDNELRQTLRVKPDTQ
ncbi:MAG: alpha/beta hydrolase [Erythrobacter sp.]|uniref:alpha/beta fold hydrolase n=1 Tax=Erythrobacter sp. TaxID=1042 RepID=UPI0032998597